MRPDAFSEIDIANDFSRGNIDNHHVAAVSSRLADAGVPVDRNVCQLAIARSCNFVPCDTGLGNLRNLLSSNRIDDPKAVITFVSDQQQPIPGGRGNGFRPGNESEW